MNEWCQSSCVDLWGCPADSQPWFLFKLPTLHRNPGCGLFSGLLSVCCWAYRNSANEEPTACLHAAGLNDAQPSVLVLVRVLVCGLGAGNGVRGMQCLCYRTGRSSVWTRWLNTISTQPFITVCTHRNTQLRSEHTLLSQPRRSKLGQDEICSNIKNIREEQGPARCSAVWKKLNFCSKTEFILSCSTCVSWAWMFFTCQWLPTLRTRVRSGGLVSDLCVLCFSQFDSLHSQWAFGLSCVRSCAQWNWSGFSF